MISLDKILKEIIDLEVKFNFATNSIRFGFISKITDQQIYMLWVEPFWRFTKNGQLIISSMTCPWHENYKENDDYKKAFHSWCDTVKYLKSIPLKSAERGKELNDLVIEWKDGTKLQFYQDSNEDEGWYIYNVGSKMYYEVFPNEIIEREEENKTTPNKS